MTSITNVAIVGASGNVGSYITAALLKTGQHTITAVSRTNSSATFPEGVKVKRVDYDDHGSMVNALVGQDALVITLSAMGGHDLQAKIIKAAAEAEVPWILPNEWGPDGEDERLLKDLPMLWGPKKAARDLIAELRKSSYISVNTGFWYEWSVALPYAYGFDIANKSAVIFDGGNTPMTTSTWPRVGLVVARLLSLPITSIDESAECLDKYRNKSIYVSSFTTTQNEILASLLRVTGSKREDWTIEHSTSQDRFDSGFKKFQAGERIGLGWWLYGRIFSLDGVGNMEKNRTLLNQALGLETEKLDAYTKVAVERSADLQSPLSG